MTERANLTSRDLACIWHPYTQMKTAPAPLPIVRGEGVQIITAPFDRPVAVAEAPGLFRGGRGLEFLVVRSQVEVTSGGEATPNGFGDLSAFSAGAWREGDRVFVRVPAAAMRAGLPSVVMGWRDRLVRPDGGDGNELRRSSRLVPLSR